MRAKKKRPIPTPQELVSILDDQRLRELAAIIANPPEDFVAFAATIREAALAYVRRASAPTVGEVRTEIEGLLRAADRRYHNHVVRRLERLSETTRAILNKRGGHRTVNTKIPEPGALLDPAHRDDACAAIVRLCRVGGIRVDGRKRAGGVRSRTFKPLLHAPKPQDHPPKREPERLFVEDLQLAYRHATGKEPAATADPRQPGPFARFVQACLDDVRSGANAVELINELHRQRKRLAEQLSGTNP